MYESEMANIGDQDSIKDLEREIQKLKLENTQLKQALDMQLDRGRDRIADDISQLLVTGKWSDVTISVGGRNFALHRNILSARSSILANLLEANCKENRLVIDDMIVDVFEVLLCFIYTGEVPALEPKMAENLLAAADKYHLKQLKSIVEDFLCGQLSLDLASSSITPRFVAPLPPIARLHDPCLVALFRQLPPADLITARTVCRRWADLVPYAARSTRSLAIIVKWTLSAAEYQLNLLSYGFNWELLKLLRKEDGKPLHRIHSFSKWNSLQFRTLKAETVTAITATFPVLKELLLSAQLNRNDHSCTSTPPLSFIDHLVRLLEHFRPQLTTLKLDIMSSFESPSSCSRLGAVISSLSALKHLAFNLQWNRHQLHCPPLSILPQLTQFTTNSDSSQFVKMLRQYGRSLNAADTPLQISYSCYDGGEDDDGDDDESAAIIPQLTSLNEDLRRHFVRIEVDDDGFTPDYRTVYPHFPSLTTVDLHLSNATFRDFLTHVSQLTQLVHLFLSINFRTIHPDNQPFRLLPQLKSVKLLHLVINNHKCHTDLEQLNLAWTMPNVQVIVLGIYPLECTICGISKQSKIPDVNKQKHCLQQIFAPLKRHCAQLHTIKHNFEKSLGTAEEILAEPITEAALPSMDNESSDISADNYSNEDQAMNSD